MKIRGTTRFFLGLYALIVSLLFLFAAAAMAGVAMNLSWPDLRLTWSFLESNLWASLAACAVFLILSVMGLRFVFLRRPYEAPTLMLKSTEHGSVVITLAALDGMVLRAARKVNGLRDVQSKVIGVENALTVKLKVAFMPDVIIPDVSAELQSSVKSYIEETSGIMVRDVQIFIDSAAPNAIARVE